MWYTADEERNKRCLLGKNYQKNEESKIITYDPSDNHRGEKDFYIFDSIKNMLDIVAQEKGYVVETTLNGAHFVVRFGMTFDDARAAFSNALKNVPPVEKDLSVLEKEKERLASVTSIDIAEVLSRVSGVFVPGVEYDNLDVKHVLKKLKNYKYDDDKDVNQNLLMAFAQYPIKEVADVFRQTIKMYKAKGMDLTKIATKEYLIGFAKISGLPEKLSDESLSMTNLNKQFLTGRE